MSAPERLKTREGTWTLRGLSLAGEGLYAPEGVRDCPRQLLATAAELAEHGVRALLGQEDAAELDVAAEVAVLKGLLAPSEAAGPERGGLLSTRTRELVEMEADRNRWKTRVAELEAKRADEHDELAHALGRSNSAEWCDLIEYAAGAVSTEAKWERHRSELTALRTDALNLRGLLCPDGEARRIPAEVEIHERVAPAVEWLLNRLAELEHTVRQMCAALNGYDCPPAGETPVETAARAAGLLMEAERQLAELEAAPRTVFRAEYVDEPQTVGLYTTRDAARAHIADLAWEEEPYATDMQWHPVADEPGAEYLLMVVGGNELELGYRVAAVTVPDQYAPEADGGEVR